MERGRGEVQRAEQASATVTTSGSSPTGGSRGPRRRARSAGQTRRTTPRRTARGAVRSVAARACGRALRAGSRKPSRTRRRPAAAARRSGGSARARRRRRSPRATRATTAPASAGTARGGPASTRGAASPRRRRSPRRCRGRAIRVPEGPRASPVDATMAGSTSPSVNDSDHGECRLGLPPQPDQHTANTSSPTAGGSTNASIWYAAGVSRARTTARASPRRTPATRGAGAVRARARRRRRGSRGRGSARSGWRRRGPAAGDGCPGEPERRSTASIAHRTSVATAPWRRPRPARRRSADVGEPSCERRVGGPERGVGSGFR